MTRGQKIGTALGTIAAIVSIVDIAIDRINLIEPAWQFIIDILAYQLPVYSFLIALVAIYFLFRIFSPSKSNKSVVTTQERFDSLPLNDNCEARYSYFLSNDGITLNYMRNPDGYALYCSIHDLRLSLNGYTSDLTCPDCQNRKRTGATTQEIISRIERQIRNSLASER